MVRWFAIALICAGAMLPRSAEAQGRRVAAGVAAGLILGAIIAGSQNSASAQTPTKRRTTTASRKPSTASRRQQTGQSDADPIQESKNGQGAGTGKTQQSDLRF